MLVGASPQLPGYVCPMPPPPWMNTSFEAAALRLIRVLVAEVPLSEYARGVTGGFDCLCQRGALQAEPLAFIDRVRDAILEFVPARQQRGARRRAGRTDLKVNEPRALGMEPVEVWRFEDRIAVAAQFAVALIVGEDKDDVRGTTRRRADRQPRNHCRKRDADGEPPREGEHGQRFA